MFTQTTTIKKILTGFTATAIAVVMTSSNLWASKKVYSPAVEAGELEFEIRTGYTRDHVDSKDDNNKQKYAIGYGINDRWFSEFYVIGEKDEDESLDVDEYEWENRFQLTEQGQYFLDWGLYLAYEHRSAANQADKVEVKILMEKTLERWVHTLNWEFSQEVGGDSDGAHLETGYAWRTKYLLNKHFEPGIEYYGELGAIDQMSAQENQKHQVGPVIYGKIGSVGYEFGHLWSLNDAAPDSEWKLILEYEIHF